MNLSLELTLKLLLPPRLACLTSAGHLGRGQAHLYSCFHRLTVLAQPEPMAPANAECYDLRSQKWATLEVHTQHAQGNMGSFSPGLWVLCAAVVKLSSSNRQAPASLNYVLHGS